MGIEGTVLYTGCDKLTTTEIIIIIITLSIITVLLSFKMDIERIIFREIEKLKLDETRTTVL